MIKNSLYSYEYHQPKDYRFSLDSVFLAQKVAKVLRDHPKSDELKVLDLCAGCGVVGLELNFHHKNLKVIDFLEVQEVYLPYFEKNVAQACDPESRFRFLKMNYSDLLKEEHHEEFHEAYDIIVSNPPYFFRGEGILSPNEFKNRCRFFIDSDFKTLIEVIIFSLKPEGKAYVLNRPGSHHGRNILDDLQKILEERATIQIFDQVRSTHIIEFTKKI